jgi:hypothetical protein
MAVSGILDYSVAGPFASRVAGLHTGEAAENIAAGTKTCAETLRLWQNSPGHNANLLQSNANSIGVGVARNDQNKYKTFWSVVIADRSQKARLADPVFPPGISSKYANEGPGKARMHTCLDQYNANKQVNANGGLTWIQLGGGYYSTCNARLKEPPRP